MRLEGQSKLGYYPTPEETLRLIPTWLVATEDGPRRVFDPCCGKGEALAHIAQLHPAETFGIELSDSRAEAAKGQLDHVYNCAYEHAVTTGKSYSLILLNPPYDGENFTGGGTRMEETFLTKTGTTTKLVDGGILVYLIPYYSINQNIARHLAGWYENLRCYKLPDEEFDVFKQVVIIGSKKDKYTTPTSENLKMVMAWKQGSYISGYKDKEIEEQRATDEGIKTVTRIIQEPVYAPLPYFEAGHGEYDIPVVDKNQPFKFKYVMYSHAAMMQEGLAAIERLESSQVWQDNIPSIEPPTYNPAITPKQGHISMQVSGGMLGTNVIDENDGRKVAIKGFTRKIVVTSVDVDEDTGRQKTIEDERFENALTILEENGMLTHTTDPNEIGVSLNKFVGQLKDKILERNIPAYDFNPETWEWKVFDPLSKSRFLPGRAETGLTDFQKHLAVAQGRLMLREGSGFLMGEMGSGKTTISIAVAEYLDTVFRRRGSKKSPYPVLVMGPGIVTGKENWTKEVPEVTPGAKGQVIDIGARPVPKPMKIGDYMEWLGLEIDQDEFMGKTVKECLYSLSILAAKQGISYPKKEIAWSLKQAEKTPPRRRSNAAQPNLLDGRIGDGFLWLGLNIPRDQNSVSSYARRYSVADFLRERDQGLLPRKSYAIFSFETGKLGAGRVPAYNVAHKLGSEIVYDEHGNKKARTYTYQVAVCPHCGAVISDEYDHEDGTSTPLGPIYPEGMEQFVYSKRRFCKAPIEKWVKDSETGEEHWSGTDDDGNLFICGRPLFQDTSLKREAAASYIKKKARRDFGYFITDEVHEAKGKGTGVGWAYGTLLNVCPWSIGLTGTLFGGYSTSIFTLWYRAIGAVRKEFDFAHGDQRWASKYGLLRTTHYEEPKETDDGTFTRSKFKTTVSERPGISPEILRFGLPYCTFSSLNDIGLPLPQYDEHVVRIPMTSEMEDQYRDADGSAGKCGLFAWALAKTKEPNGKGAISVWLNTALNRPDAMFRPEVVEFNPIVSGKGKYATRKKELVTAFDAIEGIAPKEQWLIDQCLQEKRYGRKTLVYVRQTGTRDIQDRLQNLLEDAGLRVGVLKPSMKPANRATWIFRNAPKMDVLLTNAKLVKVGLNLTQFATGIFYEMEWSLYVVWQAMRRLYRPGAPKPVMMYFPVYENTMEDHLQALVGQKMASAQMFYGDEVSGALTDEDSGDLLNDLVRIALGEMKVGRADKMFSLGSEGSVSTSAYGSPILPSPTIEGVWGKEAILAWAVENGVDLSTTAKKRRKTRVPQGQQSLF